MISVGRFVERAEEGLPREHGHGIDQLNCFGKGSLNGFFALESGRTVIDRLRASDSDLKCD